MFGESSKVKTVLLTSRHPDIIDETIQKAIPIDAYVLNYIFNSYNGYYYCHIIYTKRPEYGYYGGNVRLEPLFPDSCEEDNK